MLMNTIANKAIGIKKLVFFSKAFALYGNFYHREKINVGELFFIANKLNLISYYFKVLISASSLTYSIFCPYYNKQKLLFSQADSFI